MAWRVFSHRGRPMARLGDPDARALFAFNASPSHEKAEAWTKLHLPGATLQ
jgi:hypothetical protein